MAAGFSDDSLCAREPLRCPKRRAGKTFVLLKTSRSSARSNSREIAEREIVEAIVTATDLQKPRRRPVGERFLGDQFFRQVIIEVGNQHRAIMPEPSQSAGANPKAVLSRKAFPAVP